MTYTRSILLGIVHALIYSLVGYFLTLIVGAAGFTDLAYVFYGFLVLPFMGLVEIPLAFLHIRLLPDHFGIFACVYLSFYILFGILGGTAVYFLRKYLSEKLTSVA